MILEIDNIELNYGSKTILSGIYLSAKEGEVTGILGRNGCGKTSLFNIIFGNLKPKYKTIRINGNYIGKTLFASNIIAYLPQHQLLPKKIKLNRAFKLFDTDWNAFIEDFKSFKDYRKYRVTELSSGEIRVLETYLILSSDKKIIALDEPFSFVAPIYVEKFKKMIQKKKNEKIILITDHFYNDIVEVSDVLYFLKNGYSKLINSQEDLVKEGYLISNSR